MPGLTIRNLMPRFFRNPLWGDRERWGLTVNASDQDWVGYQAALRDFYHATQRTGIGMAVNDAGYRVMADMDISEKTMLEIGAGDIRHLKHWTGMPGHYFLADISPEMMDLARVRLEKLGVSHEALLLEREQPLPLPDQSIDVIVSFYSLEHLYPLAPYLDEMLRVLKPGGTLIGAIPAEGGLAWGLGRLFTSRRWFQKNTMVDPDKIICWEHPNFADEILAMLDTRLKRQGASYWPLPWLPLLDTNLIIRFQYRKV